MSEKIGPVTFRMGETHPFMGRELTESRGFKRTDAWRIDEEFRTIVGDMEKKAEAVLSANRDRLDALTDKLLETETLTSEEVDNILRQTSGTAN